jgi:hypothetical protein
MTMMSRTVMAAAALAILASTARAQGEDVDPKKQEILNKLNNQRISLDFSGVPLDDALNYIRDVTNINIVVDGEVHTKLSEDQLKVNLKVKDLLLKSALKLMLQAKDLTASYKEGVLVILPKDKVNAAVVTRVYDVRDLLFKLQDFPGPKVELAAPNGGTPLTGATFSLDSEPKSTITEDFITELVKSNTGDKSWDDNPNCSITLANGLLVVTQSKKTHTEVDRMLNLLRQFK